MVLRVRAVFVVGLGFIVVIEGEQVILLKGSRQNIRGVAVRALRELLEKFVTVGDAVIFHGAETQIEPARQVNQPFLPFLQLD